MVEYSIGNVIKVDYFFKAVANKLNITEEQVSECYTNEMKWLRKEFKRDKFQKYKGGKWFTIQNKSYHKRNEEKLLEQQIKTSV